MFDSARRTTGFDRILLLLGLLLVAGCFGTSLVSYYVSKREIHESIVERELPLTSDTVYSEIQKDLVRPIFISSMMASDTFLRDWVINGERDVSQITKYLNEVMTRYGAFTSFFVSDRNGNYYHATGLNRKLTPDDPANAWYYRVRIMPEPYEVNVDTDQANKNTLTIFINYRVFDYAGRYIGVTGVGLTVDAVRHLLGDYQKRYQRNVYFVSQTGQTILFGDQPDGPANIRQVEGLRDIADRVLAEKAGSYQYRSGRRDHLLNVRYVPELKWYLFVEKVEDDALADIRWTLYFNLTVCALVITAILLVTGRTLWRYQTRLEELATVDKLSGLLNRQAGEVLLKQALAEARRVPMPLTVVLLDIDRFKEINDRFGHLRGDEVLQHLAKMLRQSRRESDVACRWGGEEFLLLLKNCNGQQGHAITDKLRASLAGAPLALDGEAVTITISAGVAEALPSDTPERVLDRADRSLYAAKREGRDRVMLAEHGDAANGG